MDDLFSHIGYYLRELCEDILGCVVDELKMPEFSQASSLHAATLKPHFLPLFFLDSFLAVGKINTITML